MRLFSAVAPLLLVPQYAPSPLLSPRVAVSPRCATAADNLVEVEINSTIVATLLEASFVPAVMSMSRGDVTEAKLFIAAAQASHQERISLDVLDAELAACPVQTAGRPLADEEAALRRLWIAFVYMALEEIGETGTEDGGATAAAALVPAALRDEHARLVASLVGARRASRPLSELTLDEMAGPPADGKGGAAPRDAMEAAVLTQSMRIVYLTIDVVEDVERAGERNDAKKVPRPPIPGSGPGA